MQSYSKSDFFYFSYKKIEENKLNGRASQKNRTDFKSIYLGRGRQSTFAVRNGCFKRDVD